MGYYMDYPDWFDAEEWHDFEKPCPECGGKIRAGVLFDQGCYEGLVYRCTEKKCGSQWVFRSMAWIPSYWVTPICPACEGLYSDYEYLDHHMKYTCSGCKAEYTIDYLANSQIIAPEGDWTPPDIPPYPVLPPEQD